MILPRRASLVLALLATACASAPTYDELSTPWHAGSYEFDGLFTGGQRIEGRFTLNEDRTFSLTSGPTYCGESHDWRVPRPRQLTMTCDNIRIEFDVDDQGLHSPARGWIDVRQVVERRGRCRRMEGGRCLEWETLRTIGTVTRRVTLNVFRK